jgi:hypothetical protein
MERQTYKYREWVWRDRKMHTQGWRDRHINIGNGCGETDRCTYRGNERQTGNRKKRQTGRDGEKQSVRYMNREMRSPSDMFKRKERWRDRQTDGCMDRLLKR